MSERDGFEGRQHSTIPWSDIEGSEGRLCPSFHRSDREVSEMRIVPALPTSDREYLRTMSSSDREDYEGRLRSTMPR